MKKISILLAAVMVLSMSTAAFANETTVTPDPSLFHARHRPIPERKEGQSICGLTPHYSA